MSEIDKTRFMVVLRDGHVHATWDDREWADKQGLLYIEGGLSEAEARHRAYRLIDERDAAERALGGLESLLADYLMWSLATFPHSTAASTAAHLAKEVNQELLPYPESAEEIADVVQLATHLAHRAGVSLAEAVRNKLDVLRTRKWGPINEQGFVEHMREEGEATPADFASQLPTVSAALSAILYDSGGALDATAAETELSRARGVLTFAATDAELAALEADLARLSESELLDVCTGGEDEQAGVEPRTRELLDLAWEAMTEKEVPHA